MKNVNFIVQSKHVDYIGKLLFYIKPTIGLTADYQAFSVGNDMTFNVFVIFL